MSNCNSLRFRAAILLVVAFTLTPLVSRAGASSQLLPADGPWQGVSIGFPAGGLDDLRRYKKRLPINIVRLDIDARLYAERQHVAPVKAVEAALNWTEAMLAECKRLGIGAVIQMNHFPLDPNSSYKMTDALFWNNKQSLDEVVSVAGLFAKKFSQRGGELIAYQFISEPVLNSGGRVQAPAQWPLLLGRIVSEIRRSDGGRWIIVNPAPGGLPQGYVNFQPPQDNHLIWGAHFYLPYGFTHQGVAGRPLDVTYPGRIGLRQWNKEALREALEPLREYQKQHPAPVFIGEFSAVVWAKGAEQYLADVTSIFNEYGWGWSYFSATGWHGWNPDFNDRYSDDNPKNWKRNYAGEGSARWKTLISILGSGNKSE